MAQQESKPTAKLVDLRKPVVSLSEREKLAELFKRAMTRPLKVPRPGR